MPAMVFQWFLILLPSLSMVYDGKGPLVKRCDDFDGSLSDPKKKTDVYWHKGWTFAKLAKIKKIIFLNNFLKKLLVPQNIYQNIGTRE